MWYISRNSQQIGPIDERDIAVGLAQGIYGAETMVWREGWSQWSPISHSELAKYLPRVAIPAINVSRTGAPQAQTSGCAKVALGFIIFAFALGMVGRMLNPSKPSNTSPPSTQRASPPIDKSARMQADRLKLIQQIQGQGVFGDINVRSQGATIIVKPAFYGLDFKDKQAFVSVVYAYNFDGLSPYISIKLQDSRTNKNVGSFSAERGLDLE